MKQPIHIAIDPGHSHVYVEYRPLETEETWVQLLRDADGSIAEIISGDPREDEPLGVLVFFDAEEDIVGIEIISIDEPDLVAIARDFAADNDLAFPVDIRAAAAAGDPAA